MPAADALAETLRTASITMTGSPRTTRAFNDWLQRSTLGDYNNKRNSQSLDTFGYTDDTSRVDDQIVVDNLLDYLAKNYPPKQYLRLTMYFGLDGHEPMTYDQIARLQGVTRQSVQENIRIILVRMKQDRKIAHLVQGF